MRLRLAVLVCSAWLNGCATSARYDVLEKTFAQLQADLTTHATSSEELVVAYDARIAALDAHGPELRSVIAQNPDALASARLLRCTAFRS